MVTLKGLRKAFSPREPIHAFRTDPQVSFVSQYPFDGDQFFHIAADES